MKPHTVTLKNSDGFFFSKICPGCLRADTRGRAKVTRARIMWLVPLFPLFWYGSEERLSFDWPLCNSCLDYEKWTGKISTYAVLCWGAVLIGGIVAGSLADPTIGDVIFYVLGVHVLLVPLVAAFFLRRIFQKKAKALHKVAANSGVRLKRFTKRTPGTAKRSYTLAFASPKYAAAFIAANGGDSACEYDHTWLEQPLAHEEPVEVTKVPSAAPLPRPTLRTLAPPLSTTDQPGYPQTKKLSVTLKDVVELRLPNLCPGCLQMDPECIVELRTGNWQLDWPICRSCFEYDTRKRGITRFTALLWGAAFVVSSIPAAWLGGSDALFGCLALFFFGLAVVLIISLEKQFKREAKLRNKLTTDLGVSLRTMRQSSCRKGTMFIKAELTQRVYAGALVYVNGGSSACEYDHAILDESLAWAKANEALILPKKLIRLGDAAQVT
jgi:hypothetical protein